MVSEIVDLRRVLLLVALFAASTQAHGAVPCAAGHGVVLQVLGSGGPIADDGRASSGYLVWVDGHARVLVDVGGGTFLRFGEAGARFEDLDVIAISHLHTDHSADLPALLKSGSFSGRRAALPVVGPSGDGVFPGLEAFLQAMFERDGGAYGYLGAYLDGSENLPMLVPREVSGADAVRVFRSDAVEVDALRVPHGIVPTVAFRVRAGEATLVFASDQNLGNAAFVDFAKGVDLLVMHLVVPEGIEGAGRRLHAPPSVIGEVAARAAPRRVVLSHFMARSLRDIDGNVALVRRAYDGEVVLAEDLDCIRP